MKTRNPYNQEFVTHAELEQTILNKEVERVIYIASDFPKLSSVKYGSVYVIGADVIDNDPTRTNTGQSFTQGQFIVWNGTSWTSSQLGKQTLWAYQDFAAGVITSTSVTLTQNQNGDGAEFIPANFYNYASIYRQDGTDWVYTNGFLGFTGKVAVSSQSGISIVLNKIPNSITACRIWWQYQGSRPASNYIIPPFAVSDDAEKLDTLFVSQDEVVNNLTTNDATKVLSAAQGKILNDTKQNFISSPVNGDIVTTDATGQGQDSGKKFNDNGTTTNDIWSASKIQGLLDTKAGETLNESKGFYDRTEFNLSWSNATRTITITRTGASFSFYVNNVKVTKNSDDLKQISNTEGMHFVYYDLNGVLQDTTTWSDDIILKYVPVCFVYWDATNGVSVPDAQIETHTANNFSGIIHLQQHRSVGTRYQSGLDLSVNADGGGSNNNQIQVAGASGMIWDEDLGHSIPSRALTDNIPVLYRSGASGLWRMDATLPYIVRTTGSGRAAYNQYTAGAWQLTEITNNNFGIAYVYVCPSITNKWIVVMGQDQYNNLNLARDAAKIAPSLGALPLQEFKLVGSIIFQTSNSYTNAAKSIIVTIDGTNPYVDWTTTNASADSATVNNSDIVYLQSEIDAINNAKNQPSGYAGLDASYKIVSKSSDGVKTGYVSTATDASDGNNVYLPRSRSNGEILCSEDGVHNTGDETIDGIKTFNDSPLVPKATNGDNTTKAASTSFVTTADNNVKLFVSDNYQNLAGLDTSSGYVGLTGYSINFKDTTGARKSLLTNSNTLARTYTFQDKDGTIADLADVALKAPLASPTFTGTVTVPNPSNATDAATKVYVDNASSNASVIAKVLTGFSAAGTRAAIAATDTILQAFGKAQKYFNDLASVAFSGSATDITTGTLPTAQLPTIPETKGGTNQTTYTLGDILYSSASNTLSKLAGNTTTTKKFLSQTGNDSVSAAPAWAQVAFSDLFGTITASQTPFFSSVFASTSTTQERADNSDISWTSAATYNGGTSSDISLSGSNMVFASGHKYLLTGNLTSSLDTDPAYGLTFSFRTGGANVGLLGYLESNPNGSTSDKGVGGTTDCIYVVDASNSQVTMTLRKVTSGAGSSSPTSRGHFKAITIA